MRNLDSDVITVLLHEVDRLGDVGAGESTSSDINEVGAEDLGDERE